MDWLSFFLGFLAFPLSAVAVLVLIAVARRFQGGESALSSASTARGSTLSFSSRLIGEIGEIGERAESDASPAAKAS